MAIQVTPYVAGEAEHVNKEDKTLHQLIYEVNVYLFHFGNSWFFLLIGRSYFYRCMRSWIRVTTHLEKFLQSPRTHYSILMSILDIEMLKFPKRSFYGKHLKALSLLLSKGPNFSITSQF